MNNKIKAILSSIVARFESGDIPEAVAYSMFPVADVPSAKWSLVNRTLQFFSGTADGRGYQQWKAVNRSVRKGAKAFYILVPYIKKVENEETGEEETMLKGFMACPVFRVEDTEGEPLDYEKIELPELPLMDRAREWGISVKAIPGDYRYYGYFAYDKKEIALATPEEKTFFHELAHAGHELVKGKLAPGQDPFQEIIAELSAQVLCRLVGKSGEKYFGNSARYISNYAEKAGISAHAACLKVLSDTEKVLNLIIGGKENGIEENRRVVEEVG
jgi:hypothetical protein